MNVHERIFVYGEILYQKSLSLFNEARYRRAEITASAAGGAAMFLVEDVETPSEMRDRSILLANASSSLLGNIRLDEREEYGEHFLSGGKRRKQKIEHEVNLSFEDLRDAAQEIRRIGS
jgi:hypothetical protein